MKKRNIAVIVVLSLLSLLFAACAGAPEDWGAPETSAPSEAGSYIGGGMNDSAAYPASAADSAAEPASGGESLPAPPADNVLDGLKIVYTAETEIQTEKFQESYDTLLALLTENGGYTQNSDVSGGYTSESGHYYNRSANLTLRIPADNYKAFLTAAGDIGTVINLVEYTEDITAAYIDTDARLATLRAQESRLLELFGEANEITDLIEIESKLADVRYQIESYQSQKAAYDKLLTYSTVRLSLREVNTVSMPKDTFWQQISAALNGSVTVVGKFFKQTLIALIYLLPFLVMAFIVFLIVRAIVKKSAAKRAAKQAAAYSAAYPGAGTGENGGVQ